MQIAYVAKLAI